MLDTGRNNGKQRKVGGRAREVDIFRLCCGSVIFTSLGEGLQGVKFPGEKPRGARKARSDSLARILLFTAPQPSEKKKNKKTFQTRDLY